MHLTAVFVTILGLLALITLRRFEDKDDSQHLRRVRVVLSAPSLKDVVSRLARIGSRTGVLACERDARSGQLTGLLEVWTARDVTQERVLAEVSSAPGIEHVRVESGA